MGVYIKGMEMPRSCRDCPCFNEDYRYCMVKETDDLLGEARQIDCPLIPVPPHGRLIDADALLSKDYQVYNEYGDAIGRRNLSVYDIQETPTIIPPSGGKEDE